MSEAEVIVYFNFFFNGILKRDKKKKGTFLQGRIIRIHF